MVTYNAFVSYSHTADKPIAAALQSAIQKLGKPWYRRRALRVFRDDTSLSATPHLWPTIEQALAESHFLILLASPEAAASQWVNKEVAYWLERKSAETLLIALTSGTLAWDNAIQDFGWHGDTPLPPALKGRFPSEPRWVDLTAYRDGANKRDAKFTELAADFAAAIRGVPKEDLLSQEVRQQRKALTLAWSAVGSLLILAGFAGWQWNSAVNNERLATEQKQIAERQRDRAERTLDAATRTANGLVYDLAVEFRDRTGIPIELTRRILDKAQDLQRQLIESGENAPELRYSEAQALNQLASTYRDQGDLESALSAAERARSIMQNMATAQPTNRRWQITLSVSEDQLGDLQQRDGHSPEALETYRRSLAVRERLAAAEPGDEYVQFALSDSYAKIGAVLDALGQLDEAIAFYQKNIAILEKIAAAPSTQERKDAALDAVGFTYLNIAETLKNSGRREEAERYYRKCLEVRELLAAADPGDTIKQVSLAAAYQVVAGSLEEDHPREALDMRRKFLAIGERLVAADPGNAARQRDVSIGYNAVGDSLCVLGRLDEAEQQWRKALAIREKLVANNPTDLKGQRELGVSYNRIGIILEENKRHEEALAIFQKELEIAERLVSAEPGRVEYQFDQSLDYRHIGKNLLALNRHAQALAAYRNGIAISEALVSADPQNPSRLSDLKLGYLGLGEVLASIENRKRLATTEKLIAIDPANSAQDSLAETSSKSLRTAARTNGIGVKSRFTADCCSYTPKNGPGQSQITGKPWQSASGLVTCLKTSLRSGRLSMKIARILRSSGHSAAPSLGGLHHEFCRT
jgi:tetratricopeptide (TPR) repeat protein